MWAMPALAITASRPPASLMKPWTAASSAPASPTSAAITTDPGQLVRECPPARSSFAATRPTVAPRPASARAVARPMPRVAPVRITRVSGPICIAAEHTAAPGR